jgi:hypothetical protein
VGSRVGWRSRSHSRGRRGPLLPELLLLLHLLLMLLHLLLLLLRLRRRPLLARL